MPHVRALAFLGVIPEGNLLFVRVTTNALPLTYMYWFCKV